MLEICCTKIKEFDVYLNCTISQSKAIIHLSLPWTKGWGVVEDEAGALGEPGVGSPGTVWAMGPWMDQTGKRRSDPGVWLRVSGPCNEEPSNFRG